MVKTRYPKADPNHMAEVGLAGPDGKEIPVSLNVRPSRVGREIFPTGL